MGKGWLMALGTAGLVLAILLVLAWRDAGIEPVRPLTAPAVLPGVGQ